MVVSVVIFNRSSLIGLTISQQQLNNSDNRGVPPYSPSREISQI